MILDALLNMNEKNDNLEKGGEPMSLSELDGLWDDLYDEEKGKEPMGLSEYADGRQHQYRNISIG